MKAVQVVRWHAPPELRDVAMPEPGPGEVLVKVAAAGLCHSDLHVLDWERPPFPWRLPFTLGHETAGTVAALGPGTAGVAEGDAVLVYAPRGCDACTQCIQGALNLCLHRLERPGTGAGLGYDGGLADYLLVPSSRLLVPIGDLDPVKAAPLADAALTPYHALKPVLPQLVPGSSVLVIGVGGLGHPAVQLLRELSSARIVAVDLREESRRLALAAGAAAALDADGLEAADVRAELGGTGATAVFDFVGNDRTLALAAATLAPAGHVSAVGIGGGTFPMGLGQGPIEFTVRRPSWGTLPELHEVVALARSGAIEIEVEPFPLDETVEAYDRLRHGAIAGRAVAVP